MFFIALDSFIKKGEKKKSEDLKTEPSSKIAVDNQFIKNISKEDLWEILRETVYRIIMFPNYLSYVEEHILPENPEISPEELVLTLGISLGEAIVILHELLEKKGEKK